MIIASRSKNELPLHRDDMMTTNTVSKDTIIFIEEELTQEQWEELCKKKVEEIRRKLKEAHANRNSTAPWKK